MSCTQEVVELLMNRTPSPTPSPPPSSAPCSRAQTPLHSDPSLPVECEMDISDNDQPTRSRKRPRSHNSPSRHELNGDVTLTEELIPDSDLTRNGAASDSVSARNSSLSRFVGMNFKVKSPAKRPRIEQPPFETRSDAFNVAASAKVTDRSIPMGPPGSSLSPPPSNPLVRVQVGTKVFELQQSCLKYHSKWFSRHLSRDATEITLMNICADDFGNLVCVLEKPFDFFLTPPPTLTLISLHRACTALSCDTIATVVMSHLNHIWSIDHLTPRRLSHPVEMIKYARRLHMPQLLCRAFYEIMRQGADSAVQGLSDNDNLINLRLQLALQKEWMSFASTPPFTSCDLMPTGTAECSPRGARESHWVASVLAKNEKYSKDPICALTELRRINWAHHGYCSPCAGRLWEVLKARRGEWWVILRTHVGGDLI